MRSFGLEKELPMMLADGVGSVMIPKSAAKKEDRCRCSVDQRAWLEEEERHREKIRK